MSLETKHIGKLILYNMLKAQKNNETLDDVIPMVVAMMDQSDVKVVQKEVDDWYNKRHKEQNT